MDKFCIAILLLNTPLGYWERQTIEVCQVDFIAVDTIIRNRSLS
jgi:hypothetical protein